MKKKKNETIIFYLDSSSSDFEFHRRIKNCRFGNFVGEELNLVPLKVPITICDTVMSNMIMAVAPFQMV